MCKTGLKITGSPIVLLKKKLEDGIGVCVVCNGTAFNYHYGVLTCEACNIFFRRSIEQNRTYCCLNKNNCSIKKPNRNMCRACRLRCCFKNGMKLTRIRSKHYKCKSALSSLVLSDEHSDLDGELCEGPKICFISLAQTDDLFISDSEDSSSPIDSIIEPAPIYSTTLSSQVPNAFNVSLINGLIQIEQILFVLKDQPNEFVTSYRPFNEFNITFETAFNNPELISKRHELDFSGQKLLNPIGLICGWRRSFTHFIDYVKLMPAFNCLSFTDQLLLAKMRIIAVSFWSQIYQTYLSGKDGICFGNGQYQPDKIEECVFEFQVVLKEFWKPMMPLIIGDLLLPIKLLKLDAAEFVLIKALILFNFELRMSEKGLETVKKAHDQYLGLLYHYIDFKLGNNEMAVFERYMKVLNFVSVVLKLSIDFCDHVQINPFFGIVDLDLFPTN